MTHYEARYQKALIGWRVKTVSVDLAPEPGRAPAIGTSSTTHWHLTRRSVLRCGRRLERRHNQREQPWTEQP